MQGTLVNCAEGGDSMDGIVPMRVVAGVGEHSLGEYIDVNCWQIFQQCALARRSQVDLITNSQTDEWRSWKGMLM